MLHNEEQYIKNGVFCNDVVDLIVAAASKCLQLNLFIFQNVHGKIHVVNQISHPPCTRDAFLKYANEHYKPIVSDPDFSPAGVPKESNSTRPSRSNSTQYFADIEKCHDKTFTTLWSH